MTLIQKTSLSVIAFVIAFAITLNVYAQESAAPMVPPPDGEPMLYSEAEEMPEPTSSADEETTYEDELQPLDDTGDFGEGESKFIIIAEVNIYDALILEQSDNSFYIEFDLQNDGNVEPEVLYGIELYTKETEEFSPVLVDEYVFPEVVSLDTGEKIHREVTYAAPSFFSGEHTIRVVASNKKGLKYGISDLGAVTLNDKREVHEQYILPDTCVVSVVEGEEEVFHGLTEGVDLDSSTDVAYLFCEGAGTVYETEYQTRFEYYERSVFGDIATEETVSSEDVVVEGEDLKITIPIPQKPQSYWTKMRLFDKKGEQQVLNTVSFRIVVQGESATVKNANIDKSSYVTGETAKVMIYATGHADVFPEARGIDVLTADPNEYQKEDFLVDVQLMSEGNACSETQRESLPAYGMDVYEVEIPITQDCPQPTVRIEIVTAEGAQLDKVEFTADIEEEDAPATEEEDGSSFISLNTIIYIVVGALALIVMIVVFVLRGRNKEHDEDKGEGGSVPPVTMLLLMFVGLLCFLPGNIEAASWSYSYIGLGMMVGADGTYNLNTTSIPCGGSVVGSITMSYGGCDNVRTTATVYAGGSEVDSNYHEASTCHTCTFNSPTFGGSKTVTNPSSSGSKSYPFAFRMQRHHMDSSVAFVNTQNVSLGYTVGACVSPTSAVVSNTGCARTGDNSRYGSVAIRGGATGGTPSAYRFRCGSQGWTGNLSSNTYTCNFQNPGTYTIQTRVLVNGTWYTAPNRSASVSSCGCGTSNGTIELISTVDGLPKTSFDQDETFDIDWSFSNTNGAHSEPYTCTVQMPTYSSLANQTVFNNSGLTYPAPVSDSGTLTDYLDYAGPSSGYSHTYRLVCNGNDSCPDLNIPVSTSVVPPPLTANLTINDGTNDLADGSNAQVTDWLRYYVTADGGVPLVGSGEYNVSWEWFVDGAPHSTDGGITGPAGTDLHAHYKDKRFGIEGANVRVTVTITDQWGANRCNN